MHNLSPVDQYISGFKPEIQAILTKLRLTIKNAAPGAEEVISYQMPAYKQNGMLAYFAVHTFHIGFYPGTLAIMKFREQISGFKTSKGTIQFPLDQPVPYDLVEEIIKFRVEENLFKLQNKKKKK